MKLRPFPPMPPELIGELLLRGFDIYKSGEPPHYHHAILSRGDVMGLPDEERAKINSKYNILVIPASYNTSHANIPSRDKAYRMLRKHYTKHQIHKWFNSVRFKEGPPFRLPED